MMSNINCAIHVRNDIFDHPWKLVSNSLNSVSLTMKGRRRHTSKK